MTRRTLGLVAGALAVVLVVGAVATWWFVLRDDAPPEAALPDRPPADAEGTPGDETDATDPDAPGADDPDGEPDADNPDGTWVTRAGGADADEDADDGDADEVFVGYRIDELFAGDTVRRTAAGRTADLDGRLELDGTTVTEVTVTADMTTLESDQSRRDDMLRTRGLETEQYPEATFTAGPFDLPDEPALGAVVETTVRGELTLRGVTREVDVDIEARWNGDTIDVAGRTTIRLENFDIEAPTIAGFIAEIDDEGTMEFQLVFVRA